MDSELPQAALEIASTTSAALELDLGHDFIHSGVGRAAAFWCSLSACLDVLRPRRRMPDALVERSSRSSSTVNESSAASAIATAVSADHATPL